MPTKIKLISIHQIPICMEDKIDGKFLYAGMAESAYVIDLGSVTTVEFSCCCRAGKKSAET